MTKSVVEPIERLTRFVAQFVEMNRDHDGLAESTALHKGQVLHNTDLSVIEAAVKAIASQNLNLQAQVVYSVRFGVLSIHPWDEVDGVTILMKKGFSLRPMLVSNQFKFAVSLIALRAIRVVPLARCEFSALPFKFSLCAVPGATFCVFVVILDPCTFKQSELSVSVCVTQTQTDRQSDADRDFVPSKYLLQIKVQCTVRTHRQTQTHKDRHAVTTHTETAADKQSLPRQTQTKTSSPNCTGFK
jgi:hypothetical protein